MNHIGFSLMIKFILHPDSDMKAYGEDDKTALYHMSKFVAHN
jgi:hypothetical protein